MVAEHCTLRCKLCLAYIPYYSRYEDMSLEEARAIFKKLFTSVGAIEKVSITGGEPLVNRELCEILQELFQYENKIVKEIIIVTNGTILIKHELLSLLQQNSKVKVIVNNYGDLSSYAQENYKNLLSRGIQSILYDEANRYGWIDCRDHMLKHVEEQEIIRQSNSCAFFVGKKYVIKRGELHTCTRSAFRIQENIIEHTEDDYIDLLRDECATIRKKLEALLNKTHTTACAYCDGLTENTLKHKAAEQLKG